MRATRRWLASGAAVVVVAGAAITAAAMLHPAAPSPAEAQSPPPVSRSATPTPTPTPTPTRTGPAANTTSYNLAALPDVDVFSVNPRIPVDNDPGGTMTGLEAHPTAAAIPVFADPAAAPVAKLQQNPQYGGGTVPVIAAYTDWVKVLLAGRQGVPPAGNAHQTYGWLRRADVTISANDTHIVVSISKHTIDIVRGTSTTVAATDFAWGTPSTPTPIGRTFVMLIAVNPSLAYTRGHPIVYLATQSPTLQGFDGQSVAVTAMHYYDDHSGPISNGCIRMGAQSIELLDKVPEGTVVYIQN